MGHLLNFAGLVPAVQVETLVATNATVATLSGYWVVGVGYRGITTTANDDLILRATGTGAIQAAVTDSAATGGNARGSNAVDFQTVRAAANQVASGQSAVVVGGANNRATSIYSTVCGGFGNISDGVRGFIGGGTSNTDDSAQQAAVVGGTGNHAGGDFSFVGGGSGNVLNANGFTGVIVGGASNVCSDQYGFVGGGQSNALNSGGDWSVISGGLSNTMSGAYATIAGGRSNNATALYASIGGGNTNAASGVYSTATGGQNATASGDYSSVNGGYGNTASGLLSSASGEYALADHQSERAHAAGRFSATGDAQLSDVVLRRTTTDATPTECFIGGVSVRFVLATNTYYNFSAHVIVSEAATGAVRAWQFSGAIRNLAGVVALIGTVDTPLDKQNGANAAAWVCAISATTGLSVNVTGSAAQTLHWVASIRLTKVM